MTINQILVWDAPDQFAFICCNTIHETQPDSELGCPRPISFDFLLNLKWKSSRLWCPRPIFLDFLLTFKIKSSSFCSGLAQTNFHISSVIIEIKINQILFWGAQNQFPLIFYEHLNESQSDSALACPRQFVFEFLLKSTWKSIRFCSVVSLTNFHWFSNKMI